MIVYILYILKFKVYILTFKIFWKVIHMIDDSMEWEKLFSGWCNQKLDLPTVQVIYTLFLSYNWYNVQYLIQILSLSHCLS